MSQPQTVPVHAEVDPDALRQAADALVRQGMTVQRAIDLIVSTGGRRMGGEWAPPVIVTARAGYATASPAGISRPGSRRGRFWNGGTGTGPFSVHAGIGTKVRLPEVERAHHCPSWPPRHRPAEGTV